MHIDLNSCYCGSHMNKTTQIKCEVKNHESYKQHEIKPPMYKFWSWDYGILYHCATICNNLCVSVFMKFMVGHRTGLAPSSYNSLSYNDVFDNDVKIQLKNLIYRSYSTFVDIYMYLIQGTLSVKLQRCMQRVYIGKHTSILKNQSEQR